MPEIPLPQSTPVLVIGGGLAGHSAALSAAEAGCRVLLLEKGAEHGGSSRLSSGSFAFAGTGLQRESGIEDSGDGLAEDIISASGGLADRRLVDLYVARQSDTFDWLKACGVKFHKIALSSNMSVPRTHPTDPQQLMDAMHAAVLKQPLITYAANAAVSRLVPAGRGAEGFTAIMADTGAHIEAGAVVLASGGFSRNRHLIAKFAPHMSRGLPAGAHGNLGDGLLMGWSLGADLLDMPFVNGTFGMIRNENWREGDPAAEEAYLRLAIYKGAIVVNLEGKRFTDESISYKTIGEKCLAQPDATGFQIFDARIMAESEPAPTSHDLRGAWDKGLVKQADTIRSLAQALQIDADALEKTVADYNEDAVAGRDRWYGRTSLSKTFGRIAPLATPPFYGFRCTTAILATYCGFRVDTQMRALDVHGEPIRRLYAAGEIVGGFHGMGYMSGTALGKAAIFGRVAGRTAAGQAI